MYIVRMLFAALAAFVLQVTLVHWVSLAGCTPDMVLVLLVVLLKDRKVPTAVVIGFLLGFLQDLGNASYLGMNAMSKSIIAYGIARYASGYLPDNTLFKGLLIFIAALLGDLVILNITSSFNPVQVFVSFFRYSLLSALYSALIGIVVFNLLRLLPQRVVRAGGRY